MTASEAVLSLQRPAVSSQHPTTNVEQLASLTQPLLGSVIRMRLAGANSAARVYGASPLPGKSNYFIGNDPAKWRHNIPQFAQVQYQSVYPGVDLVYYGNQGELEYDFRLAPGANPNQIALDFAGAAVHIASANSDSHLDSAGDLILSTANGDVRFHAPRIYQPAAPASANSPALPEKSVAGSFRQLAANKIGFSIPDSNYDHTRELIIDPTLTYATYIGGAGGNASNVQVAVDTDLNIYVAGSTTSPDFPVGISASNNPSNPPYQSCLGEPGVAASACTASTAQNIFIAVINPTKVPPAYSCTNGNCTSQLLYATYLGGSGTDTLAGLAVDSAEGIYVAGTTTSTNFPTTSANAFQPTATFTGSQTHGFLSKISNGSTSNPSLAYTLSYSTYLAGNGNDVVTGLAIDTTCGLQACNAYVTGNTTSTSLEGNGFPANANAYQLTSNGTTQFFASKINTNGAGPGSMLYSTYFGGGYPAGATAIGGGIAVDSSGNIYITGTTNMMQQVPQNSSLAPFPTLNGEQTCLDQGSNSSTCTYTPTNPNTATDAFVAKFNPNYVGSSSLLYATYLGGSGNEVGTGIAVDSSSDAYVTGSTNSAVWSGAGTPFQGYNPGNGNSPTNAFLAEIAGAQSGPSFPLTYLTYLGGPGDIGNAVAVNSISTAYVAGNTAGDFTPLNWIQPNPPISNYSGQNPVGGGDAFVAAISTTSGQTNSTGTGGDYLTYLGGSGTDHGTSIALDTFGAVYVAGDTVSSNFPATEYPFQATLDANATDAFVAKIGSVSQLSITAPNPPSPSPASAGVQVTFTFNITNNGPDPATAINFDATALPNTGLASLFSAPTGQVTASVGSCAAAQPPNDVIPCNIPTLAAGATATVTINVTTNDTTTPVATQINAAGTATSNGEGTAVTSPTQTVAVVDFTASASTQTPIITAGETATIVATFCPSNPNLGYSATITPSDSITPSMDTASTPTFNPTPVTLSGSACETSTLTIPTVARPVTSGSLRRGIFSARYAAWLPIGGLSLIGFGGLGLAASPKRRRLLAALLLTMIAGLLLLQPACGSKSTPTPTPTGTQAGVYNITIIGSAGTAGATSHNAYVQIRVN